MRDFLQCRVEALVRGHGAHIAGRSLRNDAGNLALVLRESLTHRIQVVIRNDDGVLRRRTRNTRRIRQAERRHARARRCQQRIHVPVVAPLKLQHLRAARITAGQTHRRHGRLRAGVNHAHLIGRSALDDFLRQQRLALRRRAKAQPAGGSPLHDLHDFRVRIAVNHRAIRAHEVDVLIAVDIPQARSCAPLDHAGLATHGAESAHRRVHPARDHFGGTLEPLLRLGSIRHVCHSSDSRDIQKFDCACRWNSQQPSNVS